MSGAKVDYPEYLKGLLTAVQESLRQKEEKRSTELEIAKKMAEAKDKKRAKDIQILNERLEQIRAEIVALSRT